MENLGRQKVHPLMPEFWKCVVITNITCIFLVSNFFHVFPDSSSSKPQTEPCYRSFLVSKAKLCWLLHLITHNVTILMHVWFWLEPFQLAVFSRQAVVLPSFCHNCSFGWDSLVHFHILSSLSLMLGSHKVGIFCAPPGFKVPVTLWSLTLKRVSLGSFHSNK